MSVGGGEEIEMDSEHGSSVSKEVARIASQAEETFKGKGCRWDTYFYKVVLSGNVGVIKQVVDYMDKQGSAEALDWLFKREEFEEKHYLKEKRSKRLLFTRVLLFAVMTVVTILLTPLFYTIHILTTSFLNRKQRRISANIHLPLAYAAFSQSKEMLTFFLSQGVELEHIDHRGNNIFHYISDLSSVAADTAIQIFCSIVREINDHDSVKQLLEHDRNSAGLTAVEYAAKFGAPSLLSHILKHPDIMHHTAFSASAEHVQVSKSVLTEHVASNTVVQPPPPPPPSSEQTEQHAGSTRVELVDVSMYEAGRLSDQSTLLNILSDRDVASMSRTDLLLFSDAQFTGKWLILKCKQMIPGVIFFQILDMTITILLVYLLSTSFSGERGVDSIVWSWKGYRNTQLTELKHIVQNTSSILKDSVFHEGVSRTGYILQVNWLYSCKEREEFRHLLNVSTLEHVFLKFDKGDYIPSSDWDALYEEVVLSMPDSNITDYLHVARNFPLVLHEFSLQLLKRKQEFFHGSENLHTNYDDIDNVLYEQLTIKVNDKVLRPKPYVDMMYLRRSVCEWASRYSVSDYRLQHPSISYAHMRNSGVINSCDYQQFMSATVEKKVCQHSDDRAVLHFMFASFNIFAEEFKIHEFLSKLITRVVIVSTYLYIILDIFERCVFLTNSVVDQTSPRDMFITALGQKVPGSYVRRQLNVLSAIAILTYFHFEEWVKQAKKNGEIAHMEYYSYRSLATMVFIIAIVVRFLMHIHSLRLLPGIGHFVITTFMMATNLLHFSAVFSIVLVIFSLLFHILIDDPDCPLEKAQGFVTLQDSLFSTFQLTFGHGNLDPFFSSAPVQLTYVLYVIIVGLLLLNLIIAIMSTTATDVMADPWREVLWKVEWLDEATSVEYTFSVITLPFRSRRVYFFHDKAGYMVKKMPDSTHKIYMKCFYCPALMVQQEED